MSRKLQTTFYNGRMEVDDEVNDELERIHTSINDHAKRSSILNYFKQSTKVLKQQAGRVLQAIVDDMIYMRKKNYCGKYDIWAGDILYLFCMCNPSRPYIDALEVQLLDMETSINGGRCMRLYPLLQAVYKSGVTDSTSTQIEFVDEDTSCEEEPSDSSDSDEEEIEIEF